LLSLLPPPCENKSFVFHKGGFGGSWIYTLHHFPDRQFLWKLFVSLNFLGLFRKEPIKFLSNFLRSRQEKCGTFGWNVFGQTNLKEAAVTILFGEFLRTNKKISKFVKSEMKSCVPVNQWHSFSKCFFFPPFFSTENPGTDFVFFERTKSGFFAHVVFSIFPVGSIKTVKKQSILREGRKKSQTKGYSDLITNWVTKAWGIRVFVPKRNACKTPLANKIGSSETEST
jgi:hypothetical protein